MEIVLASGSPRRKELLTMIGIDDFTVIPDLTEEEMIIGLSPDKLVKEIALIKAKNVSQLCDNDDLIIAADTLVFLENLEDNTFLAVTKPVDKDDAFKILRSLSGRRHMVYTGVALLINGDFITDFERTDVFFREISDDEIHAYIATGEPMDKAGAYGAQGKAAIFVKRIEGDFFNVMGLPLCKLSQMLKDFCKMSIIL
jgi:septum formation protein